jgi:hypothetical protein
LHHQIKEAIMKLKTSLLTMAALAVGVGSAGSAAAATVFNYAQTSAFVFNSVTPQTGDIGVHGTVAGLPAGPSYYESLWWGPDATSRQQVGPSTPIVTTLVNNQVTSATAASWTTTTGGNGEPDSAVKVLGLTGSATSVNAYVAPGGAGWVPISAAFHSNQTIPSEPGVLTSGIVRSRLLIDGAQQPWSDNDVNFNFFETPNADSDYNCPSTSTSCDIFALQLSGFNTQSIQKDGKTFDVYFSLLNLSTGAFVVGDTAPLGWGENFCNTQSINPNNHFCVLTRENQVNYFSTGMLIVERQAEIPEPATMGLLGLGLLGMGVVTRRRRMLAA